MEIIKLSCYNYHYKKKPGQIYKIVKCVFYNLIRDKVNDLILNQQIFIECFYQERTLGLRLNLKLYYIIFCP